MAGESLTDASDGVPSLQEIARRAGIGRATVYRYFPNRHELAEAVMSERIQQLRDALGDDGHTFRELLTIVLRTQLAMRPLVALVRQRPDREQQTTADRLARVLTPYFEQAHADGELRPDARPSDVKLFLAMLDAAAGQAAADGMDVEPEVTRMIDTLLDGLFETSPGYQVPPGAPSVAAP